VDASTIERAWRSIGRLRAVQVRSRDGAGAWGGRVRSVRIAGSRQTLDVAGGTFAARLGLRSRWYRVHMPPAAYRFDSTLGMRSFGRAVAELQRRLRENGLYRGSPTGIFDARTRDALLRYQRHRRIRPTGQLGPLTRARLNAEAWP
jgi:hypothetical protein